MGPRSPASWQLGRSMMLALGVSALATSLHAQNSSDVPAGALVFGRDVPARAAQAKEPPGTPHYVGLDQTALIEGTLGAGVAPLADQEISGITAGSGRVLPFLAQSAPDSALANIPSQIASSTGQLSSSSAGTAGQIAAPMNVIGDAMSVVNTALGSGH